MKLLAAAAIAAALGPGAAFADAPPVADDTPPKTRSHRVEAVQAYRQAKHDGDWERAGSLLSSGARIWFGKKEGEGSALKAKGGPWTEWDRAFNASSTPVGEYEENDTSVSVVVDEINDYYRLLDRPAKRYRARYLFDADGKIAGLVIENLGDGDAQSNGMGRTDEFQAWARAHHPDEITALMPEGEIVPGAENAKKWRALLTEWRAAAGLPAIE